MALGSKVYKYYLRAAATGTGLYGPLPPADIEVQSAVELHAAMETDTPKPDLDAGAKKKILEQSFFEDIEIRRKSPGAKTPTIFLPKHNLPPW